MRTRRTSPLSQVSSRLDQQRPCGIRGGIEARHPNGRGSRAPSAPLPPARKARFRPALFSAKTATATPAQHASHPIPCRSFHASRQTCCRATDGESAAKTKSASGPHVVVSSVVSPVETLLFNLKIAVEGNDAFAGNSSSR